MQALRVFSRARKFTVSSRLIFPTTALTGTRHFTAAQPTPWFVDSEPSLVESLRHAPPHLAPNPNDLPDGVPENIKQLYSQLRHSPYLDPSTLSVQTPVNLLPGPPLPKNIPKGRRKRGRTYSGEGLVEEPEGIWNWILTAQVKEGTENRGSIEAVVRIVRKTLLAMEPPLSLPPNSKRRMHNGWAMIDAGSFAVHIISSEARQKYFEHRTEW
ncbi:hypothetical protein BJ138DRAFT_1173027 [Hygrophoropsis aurantiaca]|uniref:Uncharacterized protein n=1 Tax=Hygrophoropsis aurantiaca TaxID=72124 RepID=A0ACB8AC38_9AGAM|nr:hypothetical protein BJ138DRAFT_1173027 [Hygrophoropsis aurantiaca]